MALSMECAEVRRLAGLAVPRTCPRCGLGPCAYEGQAVKVTIVDDKPAQAEDPATLEARIMDSRIAKSAAEWWAKREIERLRSIIAQISDVLLKAAKL